MKYLALFFTLMTITCCENKKYEYHYFDDGKVRIKAELLNNKRNGELLEYYPDGNLKLKQTWLNGYLEGSLEEYYEDGSIYRKAYLKEDKFVNLTSFFPNGKVLTQQLYDTNGDILEVEKFKNNGERDSAAYPFLFIPYNDTVKLGTRVSFKARIVNVLDSIYRDGELIITSELDSTSNKMLKVKDTLELIRAKRDFDFKYEFIPKELGKNFIHGQFFFRKDEGEEIVIVTSIFSYPYYVVE